VKHWSGRIRCERHRWLQYGAPGGRRSRPSSGPSGSYGPGLFASGAGASLRSSRAHPYAIDPAAAREYRNPVAEIRRKAELVRAYLGRTLPHDTGAVFAARESVQAFVLLTAAADIEVAPGDPQVAAEVQGAVVQRGDVPAFIRRLQDQRHWLKALLDPLLPSGLRTPGAAELVAAREALLSTGTWDLLELQGRTLRGDVRLEGRLGAAVAGLGGRVRVAEVRFWHGAGGGVARLRRALRALWEGEVLCSAEMVRIREAGQSDLTAVAVAEIQRLVLSVA